MKKLDDYLKKHTDKISFVEIKKDAYVDINGYKVKGGTPLPILTKRLAKEIKDGVASEELNINYIVDGIIYTIGIDMEFKYIKEYKNILYNYDEDIEEYILYKGIKKMGYKDYENGAIIFRALIALDKKNVKAIFNYGLCLEGRSNAFFENENQEQGKLFLSNATNAFETIIDIEPKFSLAYYKLGYHYRFLGQSLKAKLMWEKFILIDENKERIQEIREALDTIEDDVEYEEGVRLIFEGKYEDGNMKLLKLKDKYPSWWSINYMLGISHIDLGMEKEAIGYFKETLDLEPEEVDVYNDIGIHLSELGKFEDAIKVLTKGIKKDNKDYKIIFNRGLVYLQLGQYELAKIDIDRAHKLNPNNIMIGEQKELLDSLLGSVQ